MRRGMPLWPVASQETLRIEGCLLLFCSPLRLKMDSPMTSPLCRIGFFMILGFAAGCGKGTSSGRKTVYPVTGTVTLSGGPVPGATVTLSPREGQPVAYGTTDDSGKFKLSTYDTGDGAVPGAYVALVLKPEASPTANANATGGHDPNQTSASSMHNAAKKKGKGAGGGIPEKYSKPDQSDLKITVEAKSNTIDLPLKP